MNTGFLRGLREDFTIKRAGMVSQNREIRIMSFSSCSAITDIFEALIFNFAIPHFAHIKKSSI